MSVPSSCILFQNFNYTWFCRSFNDPEHPRDAENRPQIYGTQAIPDPLFVTGSTGGGCFGSGPGEIILAHVYFLWSSLSHSYDNTWIHKYNKVKWTGELEG